MLRYNGIRVDVVVVDNADSEQTQEKVKLRTGP